MKILDSRFRGNDRKGMEMAYKKVRMIEKKTGMPGEARLHEVGRKEGRSDI